MNGPTAGQLRDVLTRLEGGMETWTLTLPSDGDGGPQLTGYDRIGPGFIATDADSWSELTSVVGAWEKPACRVAGLPVDSAEWTACAVALVALARWGWRVTLTYDPDDMLWRWQAGVRIGSAETLVGATSQATVALNDIP